MPFHIGRYRVDRGGFLLRLWEWHDDHPLPLSLQRPIRASLHALRNARYRWKAERVQQSETAVSRKEILQSRFPSASPNIASAQQWFEQVHLANEELRDADGAWWPQPFATYAGYGVSIEEVAFRVISYLEAYRATDNDLYRQRARAGADYLLRHRLLADGHIELQGHLSIDFCYPWAGLALLAVYRNDLERIDCRKAAVAIGEQLLLFQIAGSANHALMPVRLFAALYRETGDRRYLKALKRRVLRFLPQQRPQGDWYGYNGLVWYHAIVLRCLIDAYTVTPFTLENSLFKDRTAAAIIAALNWFIRFQREDGLFPLSLDGDQKGSPEQMISHTGGTFVQHPCAGGYPGSGGYEIDALVAAFEHLHVQEILPVVCAYSEALVKTERFWRLEFNSLAASRYLSMLRNLEGRPESARPTGLFAELQAAARN